MSGELPGWPAPGSPHIDPDPTRNDALPPEHILENGSRFDRFGRWCCQWPSDVWHDYKSFYDWPSLLELGAGVGAASILANTTADQSFRDWYQTRVRTRDLDRFGYFWKGFGEVEYTVPAAAGLALAGAIFDDTDAGGLLEQFGGRATRAYLVGGPPMLFGQLLLGSTRPGPDYEDNSRWRPFAADNGISGHAFVGAVPFITAAMMTDSPWLQGGLYAMSVLPGWSRIEHDAHYLSQACLGWWIAYLSCSAVAKPPDGERHFTMTPEIGPDLMGVKFIYQR
jgi:hypothetical protein